MNELQRRSYLEAMGIDTYMPRLQLPGAKPSVLCFMPEFVAGSQSAPQDVAMPVEPAYSPGQSNAAELLDLLGSGTAASPKPAVAPRIAPNARASARSVPRFSLSIVRAGQLLVVDEGLTGEVDPTAYLHLIHNLLFALGAPLSQLTIDGFRWPMVGVRGHHVDQSALAARQALEAYLAKQLQQADSRYLVLMGAGPQQYVGGETIQCGVLRPHLHLPAQVIATRSAVRALSDGAIKRDIWRDLRPLVQAFS